MILLLSLFLEVNHLDLESQSGVGRDGIASPLLAVGKVWWAGQHSLLTLLKLADAVIPASDNLAYTHFELKGLPTRDA